MSKIKRIVAAITLAGMLSTMARAGGIPAKAWALGEGGQLAAGMATVKVPRLSVVGDLVRGLNAPLDLKPGVYRVRAVVRAEPVMSMGYRLILTVRPADPQAEDKRWRPEMDQLTPRPKEVWLATDEKRAAQHDADGWVTLETELALTAPQACQLAVGWKLGETFFHGEMKIENAPAPIDRLTVKAVAVEQLDRPVALGKFMADKAVYKPGMKPRLSVPVINTGGQPRPFAYRVRMAKDLEAPVVVATGQVAAAASSSTVVNVDLPALEAFGGYRFDFDLLDPAGATLATRERSAACSASCNRIGIQGIHHGEYLTGSLAATKELSETTFANAREDYICWFELSFWAPDDFSNLTPDHERYLSNVMTNQWRPGVKNIVDACRANGIGAFAYIKGNYADGRDGLRFVQRRPELATYARDTGAPMGSYDMDRIVNWDDYERRITGGESGIGAHWPYVYLDSTRPSVVDVCADQTIASAEQFGWAGVRFDGDFDVGPSETYYEGPIRNLKGKVMATPDDADFTYAANVKRYKRKVLAARPDFEFGFNHILPEKDGKVRSVPPSTAVIAVGESFVMNETIRGFGQAKLSPVNRWEGYADLIADQSKTVRALGGFLQPIGCYGMRADDYLYQSVYGFAAQAKPCGPVFSNTPYTNRLSRFVTRYAGILCADLYPIPAPESRVTVTRSADLEWRRYVSFLEPTRQSRYYVIQFVNPPVNERAVGANPYCLLRPPVRDVRVGLDTDSFETPVAAWQLDPWFGDDQAAVKLSPRSDGVDLTLPRPVAVWSVLVIECALKPTR